MDKYFITLQLILQVFGAYMTFEQGEPYRAIRRAAPYSPLLGRARGTEDQNLIRIPKGCNQ